MAFLFSPRKQIKFYLFNGCQNSFQWRHFLALSHSLLAMELSLTKPVLGQVFPTDLWHKAHPSLKGALQPAGAMEFAVHQPTCRPILSDNGTRFRGELGIIPTHNGLHCPHPPGLKLLPLPYGHHFPSPPFYLFNKDLLLLIGQLLGGFLLHLLSPVQGLFL